MAFGCEPSTGVQVVASNTHRMLKKWIRISNEAKTICAQARRRRPNTQTSEASVVLGFVFG